MNDVPENAMDRIASHRATIVLVISFGTFALMAAGLWRHYSFQTHAFDLRLHEEVIRNSLRGKFLFSDLLGRSFLGHHVSLIFALLAPVYAVCQRPEWLIILQSLVIGTGGFWLWRFARGCDLRPAVAMAMTVAFSIYPGVVHGHFAGGFHQEVLAMAFLLGFFAAEQSHRFVAASVLAALAVSCREDVALMLFVFGIQRAFRRDGRTFGIGMAVASLAWMAVAYLWIIPSHAVHEAMAEQNRWAEFGHSKSEIAIGMLSHPFRVLASVLNPKILRLFADLLFLPLLAPSALIPAAIPLVANATSSFASQSHLDGAYAALFVPWFFRAACLALSRPKLKRILLNDRAALIFFALLLALNAKAWPLRSKTDGLSEAHAALSALRANSHGVSILAQGCVLPHVDWPARADMIGGAMAMPPDRYDVIVLAEDLNPWPMSRTELRKFSDALKNDARWSFQRAGCVEIFRRSHRDREIAP
jgi:uncharacterized membrane protein